MTAQRARYCTFVACLKPVMDEEMGCFEEVAQLEDVLGKLGKVWLVRPPFPSLPAVRNVQGREIRTCFLSQVTTNPTSLPDTCEQIMEDVRSGGDSCDGSSLCLATPPSTPTTTPSSSLGPR